MYDRLDLPAVIFVLKSNKTKRETKKEHRQYLWHVVCVLCVCVYVLCVCGVCVCVCVCVCAVSYTHLRAHETA